MVVLSDDEASSELHGVNVKVEPKRNAAHALEIGFIDLTDDIFEDSDIPRHYISWLANLMEKATIKPAIVEQRIKETTTATATTTTSGCEISNEEPTESGQVSDSKT